ncbi:MAG: response regulator [Planctomycetota bacterium]|jgi:DNA-binding NarL/FixJ family response regulator
MDKKEEQSVREEDKKRILVVDDHAIVRQGLTLLINQEPDLMVCAEAEDANEALNIIETQEVDLVIVDISLNGTNGIQLTRMIKSQYPLLPILILTMHDEPHYAKLAFQAGAKGYITKHEAAETITTAIHLVLSGHDYIDEMMRQKLLTESQ